MLDVKKINKINRIFKNNYCLLNRNKENTQKAKNIFIWNLVEV